MHTRTELFYTLPETPRRIFQPPERRTNTLIAMDPERIHAYLQAACAGLGFDIGEVWFSSSENGASTVAKIGKFLSAAERPKTGRKLHAVEYLLT